MAYREQKLTLNLTQSQMFDLLTAVEEASFRTNEMDLNDIEQAIIDVLYLYDPETINL